MLTSVILKAQQNATNLMVEARLIKTALLLSNQILFRNPELKALIDVYTISDESSIESQYETVLNAMPALNPDTEIAPMLQSLHQIKNLKSKKNRNPKEIIAYKKGQKKLKELSDTFKIITQTLFESTKLNSVVNLVNHNLFLTDITSNISSEIPLFIVSEELIKEFKIQKFSEKENLEKTTINNGLFQKTLLKIEDFDSRNINKAQEKNSTLTSLLSSYKNFQFTETDFSQLNDALTLSAKALNLDTNDSEKKDKWTLTVHLASCNIDVFNSIIKLSNHSDFSYCPQTKNQNFIYISAKKVKEKIVKKELELNP
jgi:hypothetical protein